MFSATEILSGLRRLRRQGATLDEVGSQRLKGAARAATRIASTYSRRERLFFPGMHLRGLRLLPLLFLSGC